MDESVIKYLVLLIGGIFLLGLETIIPGGVVGFIGGLALVGAAMLGYNTFPEPWGMFNVIGIVALSVLTIVAWVKFFPRSVVGRMLTLSRDAKTFKSSASYTELIGQEGVAQSTLRPAGIARIAGKRVDVVAEGSWVEKGTPIKVIRADGNRITVRAIPAA